jgi:hypothetical protein
MTDEWKISNPRRFCHQDKSTAWAETAMSGWRQSLAVALKEKELEVFQKWSSMSGLEPPHSCWYMDLSLSRLAEQRCRTTDEREHAGEIVGRNRE